MKKGTIGILAGTLIAAGTLMSLTACNTGSAQPQVTAEATRVFTDSMNRQVTIPENVDRVVCVGVGALRYTSYMGAASKAAGVEDYEKEKRSVFRLYNYVNYDYFKDLPVTGTNGVPNAESITQVDPQLVIMSASASLDNDPDDLSAKLGGIPVVVVPGSDTTLDDKAYTTISMLGEIYHMEDRANELTAYLKGVSEDLNKRTVNIDDTQKPSVYVGGVSFKGVHGIEGTEAGYGPLKLINAKNVADSTGKTGAFNIDKEQLLDWQPDILFVDFNGLDIINTDYTENPDYYEGIEAVRNDNVYSQISFRDHASNLDTALADSYYAGTVCFPTQFSDVNIEEKTKEIFTELLGTDPYPDLKKAGYEFKKITIGD